MASFVRRSALDLVLERVVDVSPELVWKAWTTRAHLTVWFTPVPWKTVDCEIDLRPGGSFRTVMRSPEGQDFPNVGCYLEVVPHRRLVWTDALLPDFRPAEPPGKLPFRMTAVVALEPQGSGCRYTATAMHTDVAAREAHEKMGFHIGWGKALDQLIEHVKRGS